MHQQGEAYRHTEVHSVDDLKRLSQDSRACVREKRSSLAHPYVLAWQDGVCKALSSRNNTPPPQIT